MGKNNPVQQGSQTNSASFQTRILSLPVYQNGFRNPPRWSRKSKCSLPETNLWLLKTILFITALSKSFVRSQHLFVMGKCSTLLCLPGSFSLRQVYEMRFWDKAIQGSASIHWLLQGLHTVLRSTAEDRSWAHQRLFYSKLNWNAFLVFCNQISQKRTGDFHVLYPNSPRTTLLICTARQSGLSEKGQGQLAASWVGCKPLKHHLCQHLCYVPQQAIAGHTAVRQGEICNEGEEDACNNP